MEKREQQQKGQREGRGFAILSAIVFMAILLLPSVAWLLLGAACQGRTELLDFDLGENRNKAAFPQTFDSAFAEGVEEYYNDRLPFRSLLIASDRKLASFLGKPILEAGDEGEAPLAPKLYGDAVIEGREKWLFFALENSLEDYLGSNVPGEEEMSRYLSGMKKLEELCREQGKELFFLMPPNKEQVYAEFMPDYPIVDTYKGAQRLADYVQANSDLQITYPIQEMKELGKQWQLYFKTDTHWNDAGAFVGTQALYAMMGMTRMELSELTVEERAFSEGDLIRMGNLQKEDYAGDIRYQVYYRLNVEVTVEMGENSTNDLFQTSSDAPDQRRFVMVGDSFRISMGQYLSRDFGKCTLINQECLDLPDAAQAVREADVVVIELVERHSGNLPVVTEEVCGILAGL